MIKLISFEPKSLNALKAQLQDEFPMPIDLALKDDSFALTILEKIRNHEHTMEELSVDEMNLIYQLSKLCTHEEFNILKEVLQERMSSRFFYIGWPYCQMHANNKRATTLFSIACSWMKTNSPYEFSKTLVGRTGLPWEEIYPGAVKIIHSENLSVDEFCIQYNVITSSVFFQQLNLTCFASCQKDQLLQKQAQLAELIKNANIDFLRPALVNYSSKISYDEMSILVKEAIIDRLANEENDDFIGLSPNLIRQIRIQRYSKIFEEYAGSKIKLNVYNAIAAKINSVSFHPSGFFTISFDSYIVVDNSSWEEYAYAYKPKIYKKLLSDWITKQYAEDFWPAMEDNGIVLARDYILGLNSGGVIKLEFSDFGILYAKDLLVDPRYKQ